MSDEDINTDIPNVGTELTYPVTVGETTMILKYEVIEVLSPMVFTVKLSGIEMR